MADYTLKARLTADAKEFISGIDRAKTEMNKLQKFSVDIGNKMKSFGGTLSGIGDGLTSKITKPALTAGAAVAGITLAKGFQRLVGIDTARAKLVGLGHDAEGVEAIMGSALESVKGTAHGMDEAATTAANAVAAGVKEGKELTQYLTTTGDAAAIAGASMSEMGSILNKVKTTNKAYNGELQQLSDRGLPIYQWLAKEANVTAEEITEMSSKGQISSEMLMNAIEKNIGGAAKKMGEESFVAGIANMWAAVGRLGASFLDAGGKGGGFFSTLKPMIADFTGRIDSMGEYAERAGVKFGEMFTSFVEKIQQVKQFWDNLNPAIQGVISKIALFGSVGAVSIGPILKVVGSVTTTIGFLASSVIPKVIGAFNLLGPAMTLLSGPVGLIVAGIAALVAGFILAYQKSETFRDFVHAAFETIKTVVLAVVSEVVNFVMETFGTLVSWWGENNELIRQTAETVWNAIVTVIQGVMNVLGPVLKVAWTGIKTTVMLIWNQLKTAIEITINLVLGIIKAVMQIINGDWRGAWNTVKETATKIWNSIKSSISNIVNILKSTLGNYFTQIKDSITNKVSEAKTSAVNKFNELKSGIVNKASEVVSNVKSKFEQVKNNIMRPIEQARDKVKSAIDAIKGFFSGLSLKFPKIQMPKLPKFSLKGKFSLMPPSVPKLNVNWNAKGGIFTRPTIFNTANAGMQGVGEAGPEAILPLNSGVFSSIGRGIASHMPNMKQEPQQQQVSRRPVNIVLELDGETIGQATKDYIDLGMAEDITIKTLLEG